MRALIILGGVFIVICSAWLGAKIGWYLFFEPSSMQEAEQIIGNNHCDSFSGSFIGIEFECEAAYDYIRKNKK